MLIKLIIFSIIRKVSMINFFKMILKILFFGLIPTTAYAYLNPGTGGLIVQGILGAIAVGGVVIKLYWPRILKLFSSLISKKKPMSDMM